MKSKWLGVIAVVVAALIPLGPVMLKGEVPSFRDHEDYFVPLRAFTAEALRAGELPVWNPFSAAGEPWLANPQTGVFYPPAWIVALLPFELGYVAFLSFHIVILGLGLRRLLLLWSSDAAATLVAAAFVVSGPALSLLDVSNNLATFAWTPWILHRALQRDRPPGVGDSVLLALSFLGGEPLLAAVTWTAWAAITLTVRGRASLPLASWRLLAAVALCAVQLVPFLGLLAGSDRSAGLAPEIAFRNSMAIEDWLAAIVSPAGVQPGIGRSQVFLPSLYVCPVIVFLVLASFGGEANRRVRVRWIFVFLVSVVLASGGQFPLVGRVLESLMLTVNRYPVKFALFGFLALGVLSAIGFDRLGVLSTRARVASAAGAVLLVIAAQTLHRSAYPAIAATGLVVGLFWLAGFLCLLWFGRRVDGESKVLLVCVLLPVVVFESLAASRFLLGSATWPYPSPYVGALDPAWRVIRLEQLDAARTGRDHVRDRKAWLGGYLNLLARQADASTAAPVVDRRYQELHDMALSVPRHDILDFLSVRYVLTERDLSAFGYERVAGANGVAVFERPGARPMVVADFAPLRVSDESDAFARLLSSPTQSGRILASGLESSYPHPAPDDARARILSTAFTLDSVRVGVEVSHPALLVVNQTMRDGWTVTVDGEARPAVRANALFRGVEVRDGRHEVVWTYSPPGFRTGIFVTLAAMCALALERKRVRDIHEKMSRSFHSEHA